LVKNRFVLDYTSLKVLTCRSEEDLPRVKEMNVDFAF